MFKTFISKLLLALLIIGIVLTVYSLWYQYKKSVAFPNLNVPALPAHDKITSLPVQLQIPSLHIDAPIESVGLTVTGAMDVPQSIKNVAWFSLGAIPGEIGNSVISGHYGWKDQKSSAFDDLQDVQIGSLVHVTNASGTIVTFKVREVKIYAWNTDAKEIFISTDGKSHLNLITCAGTWDAKNKTYLKRLVVFTDKVE